MGDRILVVDDDPDMLEYVRTNLVAAGFDTSTARGGAEAVRVAIADPPSLILLDALMPDMDGLTALKRLKGDGSTATVPVVMLTTATRPRDRVEGLDLGADDYVTKPFAVEELVARVRAVIRRAHQMRDVSPLTGLPGNFSISAELKERVASGAPLAVVYGDLDNFKAYNDHYGFMRGDTVIRFTADVLTGAAAASGDPSIFVGHVGGDDFIVATTPSVYGTFCETVIERFDAGIAAFYDDEDAERGFIEIEDRRGQQHKFPVVSFSMGVATNEHRVLSSEWQASEIASEMKEFAKRQPGSTFAVDRRT